MKAADYVLVPDLISSNSKAGGGAVGGLIGGLPENASDANAQQAVIMNKPGRMYAGPDTNGRVVKSLETGTMLYPTGQKKDVLWEVTDELGAKGWVSSLLFQLAR